MQNSFHFKQTNKTNLNKPKTQMKKQCIASFSWNCSLMSALKRYCHHRITSYILWTAPGFFVPHPLNHVKMETVWNLWRCLLARPLHSCKKFSSEGTGYEVGRNGYQKLERLMIFPGGQFFLESFYQINPFLFGLVSTGLFSLLMSIWKQDVFNYIHRKHFGHFCWR